MTWSQIRVPNPAANNEVRISLRQAFKLHALTFICDPAGSTVPFQAQILFERNGNETLHVGTPLFDGITVCSGWIGGGQGSEPVSVDPITGVCVYSNASKNKVHFSLPDMWFPSGTTIAISGIDAVFALQSIAGWFEFEPTRK